MVWRQRQEVPARVTWKKECSSDCYRRLSVETWPGLLIISRLSYYMLDSKINAVIGTLFMYEESN